MGSLAPQSTQDGGRRASVFPPLTHVRQPLSSPISPSFLSQPERCLWFCQRPAVSHPSGWAGGGITAHWAGGLGAGGSLPWLGCSANRSRFQHVFVGGETGGGGKCSREVAVACHSQPRTRGPFACWVTGAQSCQTEPEPDRTRARHPPAFRFPLLCTE